MIKHKQTKVILNNQVIEIDDKCVDIVLWFNNIVGFKTKFCCQGDTLNQFSIQFDEEVTDEDIKNFINLFPMGKCFNFYKWSRRITDKYGDKLEYNWVLFAPNWEFANRRFKKVKELYEESISLKYQKRLSQKWTREFYNELIRILGQIVEEQIEDYKKINTLEFQACLKRCGIKYEQALKNLKEKEVK